MAQATALSPQALIDVAKATVTSYNDRDWAKAKGTMTPDFVYDEVSTGKKGHRGRRDAGALEGLGPGLSRLQGHDPQRPGDRRRDRGARAHLEGHPQGTAPHPDRADRPDGQADRGPRVCRAGDRGRARPRRAPLLRYGNAAAADRRERVERVGRRGFRQGEAGRVRPAFPLAPAGGDRPTIGGSARGSTPAPGARRRGGPAAHPRSAVAPRAALRDNRGSGPPSSGGMDCVARREGGSGSWFTCITMVSMAVCP